MTKEFIHEEISMLFWSEKFYGGWVGGDIAIIASSSRSRSLRDLRWTLDLELVAIIAMSPPPPMKLC